MPIGLGLMVLTTLEGDRAIAEAKGMLARSVDVNAIIDMISTIMIYKFTELSREEVDAMLGFKIDELKQTRVYREAREEERREMVSMQLNYKFGQLSSENQSQVQALDVDRLQALSKALLEFNDLVELENWF